MTSLSIGPALLVAGLGKFEALIWLPRREQHFLVKDEAVAIYKLGDWVLFDYNNNQIVGKQIESPYETKVMHSDVVKQQFIQVKVPLVFFSDKQLREVVAYAPGFGRIGSFIRHDNMAFDTMCFAWIAFAAFFKSADLRSLMFALEVKWIVPQIDRLMAKSEIIDFPRNLGFTDSFNRTFGIVVERKFLKDRPNILVIKFFTESNGLCEYCDPTAGDQRQNFPVGSWARFLPMRNFSNEFTAVNASATNAPNGISLIETEPKIKLSLFHELFYLDQNPDRNVIHAQLLGELNSTAAFVKELRLKKQKQKLFQPRLFVTFDPILNQWNPTHFDGQDNAPLPSTSGSVQNNEKVQHPIQISDERAGKPRLSGTLGADFGDGSKHFQPANNDNERRRSSFQPTASRMRQWNSSAGKLDFKSRPPNDNKKVAGSHYPSLPHRPTVHPNLQGLIVSVSSNGSNMFIYTCKFPSEEFSMCRNTTSIPEGVKHGSWVKFDLKVGSGGEKIVVHCELDNTPPNWKVTPVRNTIQIELTAFVPRKWRPQSVEPESRIVPTNWIDEMLDYEGKLGEEYADKTVKVLVARNKHPTGKTWHLEKVIGLL